MKNIKQKTSRIKKALLALIALYMFVGSIVKYSDTNDVSYLIFPAIILGAVAWELMYRFFSQEKEK